MTNPRSKPAHWLKPTSIFIFLLLQLSFAVAVFPQTGNPERRLTLESFEFVGNHKTEGQVIRRYLGLKIGDEITPVAIELSRQRLEHTNFFKEVNVYARPGSEKGRVVLIVEVNERRWPYFQFEGGHGDLDGWYFVPASLRWDNAFGNGSRIGLKWQLGDRISTVSLGYSTDFTDYLRFDAELFSGRKDFIHYFDALRVSQRVDYGGIGLRLTGTSGLFRYFFVTVRGESHNPEDFATGDDGSRIEGQELPATIAADLQETSLGGLGLGVRIDTRDNPVYPLHGVWGAAVVESINDGKENIRRFRKVTFDGRMYQRFTETAVLALQMKGGYTEPNAPFYERFYLGGANSLRGFPDRRLTPEGWGTKLFLASAELRFPLSKTRFPYHKSTAVIFFDTGGIWQNGQTPKAADLTSSFGFGVRVRLPIVGITRFDFAFPLEKIDENDYKFHISLGHSF